MQLTVGPNDKQNWDTEDEFCRIRGAEVTKKKKKENRIKIPVKETLKNNQRLRLVQDDTVEDKYLHKIKRNQKILRGS